MVMKPRRVWTYRIRYGGALLLAGAMALVVGWSDVLTGQVQVLPAQPPLPGKPDQPDEGKKEKDPVEERPEDEEDVPFSFPYDRNVRNYLQGAREYLAGSKQPPWQTVTALLQNILESKSDSFYSTYYTVGGKKKLHRVSVRTEANRIIASFPKEGLEFYQQAYGQTAAAQLEEAIRNHYDLARLTEVSQKYFHTRAGGEATVLLASLYLERSNYLEAAYAFERLWQRPNSDEFKTPLTLFKAALAFQRSGDPRHAELLKAVLADLRRLTERRGGLKIGERVYTYQQLLAEIQRPVEGLRVVQTLSEWPMRGGTPARNGVTAGGPPFLVPLFQFRLLPYASSPAAQQASDWIRVQLEDLYRQPSQGSSRSEARLPGFFPITTGDAILFRTYDGIYAVAARDQVVHGRAVRAGELLWASRTEAGLFQLLSSDEFQDESTPEAKIKGWWEHIKRTPLSSMLYENPLVGSLSHDGEYAYYVDDVWLVPPAMRNDPNVGIVVPPSYRRESTLGKYVHAGQLVAVNLKTGSRVWQLGRVIEHRFPGDPLPPPLPPPLKEDEADQATSAFHLCLDAIFLGPPLPLNGKLYVLIEQAGVIRLLCLDPFNLEPVPGRPHIRTPVLLWSQRLGQPAQSLPDDAVRRFQGCQLAASDGVIVCPTNSGAVIAVDLMSHSLLWAYGYGRASRDTPVRPGGGVIIRPGVPANYNLGLKTDRWHAAVPIIASGRVLLSAYDSDTLDCLDLRTGRLLWSVPRDVNDLYVGGVINDKVIVVGRNQVRAYHLFGEDAQQQRPRLAFDGVVIPTPTGHGAAGKGVYYIPVRPENAGRGENPSAEIWAIDVETGTVRSKTAARLIGNDAELARFGLGNLVYLDNLVIAQSAWELAAYPYLEQKRQEMDRLLAANPNDPIGLITRGELHLDEGKILEAIRDFDAALRNNPPEEKRLLLREKRYIALTELFTKDFPAAENYVNEYRALCELPPTPGELPEDKNRRLEETERRLRKFEYLMARGREKQGRLVDAFEHYLRLAQLGDARKLIDMPDEPNVRVRPDVWARGRLEALLQSQSNAEARRQLEQRLHQEWHDVRQSNDLPRLRRFVSIFGTHSPLGAEAQLYLVERLQETRNAADLQEAQHLLLQLRIAAPDRTFRARAIERLASILIQQRHLEDAVALYLQLEREYPDVVIRDNMTGADFAIRLLTDKRLLPYLEPQRYPLPARYKAELRQEPQPIQPQFELEPQGELFPMYRRFRFVLDQTVAGNGYWSLRVFDKVTGKEEMRFSGVAPQATFYLPNGSGVARSLQACGHLILLHFGYMIYCYDLSRGKENRTELWKVNLLGDGNGPNPNRGIQAQMLPNGDIVIRYDNNYSMTVGKMAVIQPSYVAVLTANGLEVSDPRSLEQRLWTRQDIKDRTQLFGDDRYLVLVETNPQGRPTSIRLLRAVDGAPVPEAPDLGPTLAEAATFTISGTQALISQGGGEQGLIFRRLDLVTGKEIWRKEFPASVLPIQSLRAEWVGALHTKDGTATIVDALTGQVRATLRIDAENLEAHVKPCTRVQLLADPLRFYLILDQNPNKPAPNGRRRANIGGGQSLNVLNINGPIYAFDRTTGQRLWFHGEGVLEQHQLVLDRFEELPVIIAAVPCHNRQGAITYQATVIEKDRGRLLFDQTLPWQGFFQKLDVNLKSGEIVIGTYNQRIRLIPDNSPGRSASRP
jgi:tetratricopeptide (TPR) repeat protein